MSIATIKLAGNGNPKAHGTNVTRIGDLGLGAYLVALDYSLVGVEGVSGRREFVFENVPKDVVVSFYSGKGLVDARKLLGAFRDLKGLTVQSF